MDVSQDLARDVSPTGDSTAHSTGLSPSSFTKSARTGVMLGREPSSTSNITLFDSPEDFPQLLDEELQV